MKMNSISGGSIAASAVAFSVVRDGKDFEVLARAADWRVARDLFRAVADLYPEDDIHLKQGARVIARSRNFESLLGSKSAADVQKPPNGRGD